MWKLPTPNIDNSRTELAEALAPQNDNVEPALRERQSNRILELYDQYDQLLGQPNVALTGEDLGVELLQAIHDSYKLTQKNRRLKSIRENLKISIEKCPYCGFGEVTELDHHIPKTIYKAHAIYSRNLVPCCHNCNNIKNTSAGMEANNQFFHSYFGTLPQEIFFKATIQIELHSIVATFEIIKTPLLDQHEFERLSFQFNKLNLNHRYTYAVTTFLSTHKTAIEMMAEIGGEALRAYLLNAHRDSTRDFGMNHWQTALLLALAESDDFCHGGYRCAFGIREMPI